MGMGDMFQHMQRVELHKAQERKEYEKAGLLGKIMMRTIQIGMPIFVVFCFASALFK